MVTRNAAGASRLLAGVRWRRVEAGRHPRRGALLLLPLLHVRVRGGDEREPRHEGVVGAADEGVDHVGVADQRVHDAHVSPRLSSPLLHYASRRRPSPTRGWEEEEDDDDEKDEKETKEEKEEKKEDEEEEESCFALAAAS